MSRLTSSSSTEGERSFAAAIRRPRRRIPDSGVHGQLIEVPPPRIDHHETNRSVASPRPRATHARADDFVEVPVEPVTPRLEVDVRHREPPSRDPEVEQSRAVPRFGLAQADADATRGGVSVSARSASVRSAGCGSWRLRPGRDRSAGTRQNRPPRGAAARHLSRRDIPRPRWRARPRGPNSI